MTTALYIGRFQPLHKGHLQYIKKILKENDSLKIVIGSSQESKTKRNPFSVEERLEMLRLCFKEENLQNIKIFSAKDYPGDNEKWIRIIKKEVGKFDVVYAGENQLVKNIFIKDHKVKTMKRIKHLRSTDIRKKMRNNEKWQHLVPSIIAKLIRKIYITNSQN